MPTSRPPPPSPHLPCLWVPMRFDPAAPSSAALAESCAHPHVTAVRAQDACVSPLPPATALQRSHALRRSLTAGRSTGTLRCCRCWAAAASRDTGPPRPPSLVIWRLVQRQSSGGLCTRLAFALSAIFWMRNSTPHSAARDAVRLSLQSAASLCCDKRSQPGLACRIMMAAHAAAAWCRMHAQPVRMWCSLRCRRTSRHAHSSRPAPLGCDVALNGPACAQSRGTNAVDCVNIAPATFTKFMVSKRAFELKFHDKRLTAYSNIATSLARPRLLRVGSAGATLATAGGPFVSRDPARSADALSVRYGHAADVCNHCEHKLRASMNRAM